MKQLFLLTIALLLAWMARGQIVAPTPALPTDNQSVTIVFDATQGTAGLKDYTGDVYAHIGVITDQSTSSSNWKYVVADWGVNVPKAKMIRIGSNKYQIVLDPNIRDFFSVPASEKILKVAMVFRSGDKVNGALLEGKDTGGKDIFVDVYQSGLNLVIQKPSNNQVLQQGTAFQTVAVASVAANLDLYLNSQKMISIPSSTQLSYTFNPGPGNYWIRVSATASGQTVSDSVYVHVMGTQVSEPRPSGAIKGINYPDSQSATLVLWAPYKQSVYLLGDFNDWHPSSSNRMKKDGDYYWLTISGLTPGKEYAFQYLVDGSIKIADPYTDKILDPSNDSYITTATYPNLKAYPIGKGEGIVSVLQPGRTKYNWQVTQFTPPAPDSCVIYETLVRDFDTKHTFTGVTDHLDYLKDLKVNVLELMPVNEFEGNSSWGYNPSFYFATDKYYGPADDLKKLVDQCHKRGIAVVLDMVLNHSYGQSPFVKLYFDGTNPTSQNPWYNVKSNFQNPDAQWGYDFNHDSPATRELVDSIASYWMSEFKVDGFRYDFTKGFSNNIKSNTTDPWGSQYDAQRIYNLERMAGQVRKRKPGALVIFEHLSDNPEEKELAESGNGILLWANANYNCSEAAMGYHDGGKSDFSWASYSARTWNVPAAVGYMESHDEERLAYQCVTYGNSSVSYNIKDSTTAYKRAALTAALFLPIPGPKMIWQFEEVGYDYSINSGGGRLNEKPVRWDYVDKPARTYLFRVMAKLIYLKKKYPIFRTTDFSYSLAAEQKWLKLNLNGENVLIVGNFGVSAATVNLQFQRTGSWHEYFTDATLEVSNVAQNLVV
ncbi:MAG: alpha-amylase, partial [Marinilabiliales bacterium]|nr:alpha-amylase [Marinilabiliales bacterium]